MSPTRQRLYTAASRYLQANYEAERQKHRKAHKLPGKLRRGSRPDPGALEVATDEEG